MSVHIRLHEIDIPNDFVVSYKSGNTLGSDISGFTLYNSYSGGTTGLTISGVTLNFDTKYWIKLQDKVTNRYIIENISIHDSCYYDCYDVTPTPTPTLSLTPTSTLAVNSATICIGDGTKEACACTRTALVYFIGTLKEGTILYTNNTLSTKYNNGLYPNVNYNNTLYVYPAGGGQLSFDGFCVTATPTPTLTRTTPGPTATIGPTTTPQGTTLCNDVVQLIIDGGIDWDGRGYISARITLNKNVSTDTQFGITVKTQNYGDVNVSLIVNKNTNTAYVIDNRQEPFGPGTWEGCIYVINGDNNIRCAGLACTGFNCVCNSEITSTPSTTNTPTPTPTKAGHCVQIVNDNPFSAIDVSYVATSNIRNCATIPAGQTQKICIKLGTFTSTYGYDFGDGTCSGNQIILNITDTGNSCSNNGDC